MPEWRKPAVTWSENLKFTEKITTLDTKSFQAWVYSVLPQVKGMATTELLGKPEKNGIRLGQFWLIMRRLPVFHYSQPFYFMFPCGPSQWQKTKLPVNAWGLSVTWDKPVSIPVLLDSEDHCVWISLSPSEGVTQRAGITRARGDVLMGGLGMGWLARRVLERKQVKSLTVYDTNEDVLDFFGQPLLEEFSDRLELVHGDVYAAQHSNYDRVLLDVWSVYADSKYDKRLKELLMKIPSSAVWAWGGKPAGT